MEKLTRRAFITIHWPPHFAQTARQAAGEPTAHMSTRQLGPCARALSYACRELIQRSRDGASLPRRVLLRGRLHFCGCALTAAISQRPPLETSVMSSDQSAIHRHLLGATSSEWCGFARAEPVPWSAGPACAHFPALRRLIPRSAWHASQRRPAAHSPRPQREVAFPARLTPGAKPSAESHTRAASVECTRVAPAAVWSSTN